MKLKLDENMPHGLVGSLRELEHDVDTVMDEGLAGRPDVDVWAGAQQERRLLITQDLDFSDLRRFEPGSHFGILLVRLREPGRRALSQRVEQLFRAEDVENWCGALVVATDQRLRVRRPQ